MMKTFFIVVLMVGMVVGFSQNRVLATSVEIPEDEMELAQAIAIDVIYSRTLERELEHPSDETDEIESMDQAHVKVSYSKFEQVQPYIKIGAVQLEEKLGNTNIAGLGRRDIKFEYDLGPSYGGGINGVFKFGEGFFAGYDLQYLRSNLRIEKVVHSGETASSKSGGEAILEEWHGALFLGKKFDLGTPSERTSNTLTPYLGVRYSELELELDEMLTYTVSEGTISVTGGSEADEHLGIFAGLLLNLGENWRFRLEGRFLDETAITISGGYRF